jgi:hypothetical protein
MIASPISLSSVPRSASNTSIMALKYPPRCRLSAAGPSRSDSVVKPSRSLNRTVTSYSSPPSFSRDGSFSICSTIAGAT